MLRLQLLEYMQSLELARYNTMKHGIHEGQDYGERLNCCIEGTELVNNAQGVECEVPVTHYYQHKKTHVVVITLPGEKLQFEVFCLKHWLSYAFTELDIEYPEGSAP